MPSVLKIKNIIQKGLKNSRLLFGAITNLFVDETLGANTDASARGGANIGADIGADIGASARVAGRTLAQASCGGEQGSPHENHPPSQQTPMGRALDPAGEGARQFLSASSAKTAEEARERSADAALAVASASGENAPVAQQPPHPCAPLDKAQSESASRQREDNEAHQMTNIDKAYPTRLRPQGQIDAQRAWLSYLACLRQGIEDTREETQYESTNKVRRESLLKTLDWFAAFAQEGQPQALSSQEALTLTRQSLIVMKSARNSSGMGHYLHWLVSRVSPETFVEVALVPLQRSGGYFGLLQNKFTLTLTTRALRSALVKTPSDYYESVLARCQQLCPEGGRLDGELMVHLAFLLADDRPHAHPLQPLAVIEAFEARPDLTAEDKAKLIPLILEAPPLSVERLRAQFKFADCPPLYEPDNKSTAVATALATAQRFGQSAVPALKWVLQSDVSPFVPLILALEDRDAPSLLAPCLHDKIVLSELDKAADEHGALIFRMILGALLAGNQDPRLMVRVKAAIRTRPLEELEQWAEGNARALAFIERERDAINRPLAPIEDWPRILRDPPWSAKKKRPAIPVLNLEPLPTPFAFSPAQEQTLKLFNDEPEYCPPIDDAIKAVLHYAASEAPYTPLTPPQIEPGMDARSPQRFYDSLGWSLQYMKERNAETFRFLFDASNPQEAALLYLFWRDSPGDWFLARMKSILFRPLMEHFGEQAMPVFMKLFSMTTGRAFDLIEDIDSSLIAPQAARAFLNLKKARESALAWLTRYRSTAITRLIPDALGSRGLVSKAALNALSWFAERTEGGQEEIGRVASVYASSEPRAPVVLEQLLNTDALELFPAKIPKAPSWFDAGSCTRPVLTSGGALADPAVSTLVQMLIMSAPDEPYAGLEQVRQAVTRSSLAAFSWDLFSIWLASDAPAKDIWAMRALGWLGDEECAHRLARLIRKWPAEAAHARAVVGLETLANMVSDTALVLLNGIAEKVKFKGLQDRAREMIAQIAQRRDLTTEELADRLVPQLDLDARGGLDLDFGSRQFRVGFDQFLRPWVKDASGQLLKDLPKPNKSDDAQQAKEAADKWKALKRDARAIASLQLFRLESMLATQRRMAPDVFWLFFASHPLVRNLTHRLLWGVYADDDPRSQPARAFRIAEDLAVTDHGDEPIEIDFGAGAKGRIGLVHPMNPPADGLDAWGAIFADYEIAQPFAQLGRESFQLTEEEKASRVIKRFAGAVVDASRMRGIVSYGWRLGDPQDAGCILWVEKQVQVGGKTIVACLEFTKGYLYPGAGDEVSPTIGELTLEDPGWGSNKCTTAFGEFDPVTASEILRAPALILAAAGAGK